MKKGNTKTGQGRSLKFGRRPRVVELALRPAIEAGHQENFQLGEEAGRKATAILYFVIY
jgi:hypothetical protein